MELAYLPDPMSRYNALSVYPTWEEINYNDKYSKTQKKTYKCKETKTSEKNCSICQQKKKRILSDYIKNNQISTSIQEEDEEAEEDDNNQSNGKQQQQS